MKTKNDTGGTLIDKLKATYQTAWQPRILTRTRLKCSGSIPTKAEEYAMTESVLLLDGGMGQELIRRSTRPTAHHLWSLKVMLDEPQLVSEVHQDFCAAGASVACLNTYAITRTRIARGEGLPSLEELLHRAFSLAEEGIRNSGRKKIALISSLPPLIASYRADIQLPMQKMISEYRELINIQAGTVDGFLAETIPSISEAEAVLTAAEQSDIRIVLALTVSDEDGQILRSGESLAEALNAIQQWDPLAIVINCSKPEAVSEALPVLRHQGIPFGAFANGFTSVDALEPGGSVDVLEARTDLDPEQYAQFASEWLDAGASIIGGCCEVGPDHIAALDALLSERGIAKASWMELDGMKH